MHAGADRDDRADHFGGRLFRLRGVLSPPGAQSGVPQEKPAVTIFKQHRKWFFGEFINPDYHRPADSTRPVVRELVTSELAAIERMIATQNDSIMNSSPSRSMITDKTRCSLLCKATKPSATSRPFRTAAAI